MLLNQVEYARPESVAEALELLSGNDNARALAGGQTLVNVMKQRLASPDLLVDLAELEELTPITVASDGSLELGAMSTLSDVIGSDEVRDAADPGRSRLTRSPTSRSGTGEPWAGTSARTTRRTTFLRSWSRPARP